MSNYLRWYSPRATDGHYEDFSYRDGPVFEDNLNEQLDSGTIIIDRIAKKHFEAFDIVDIFNDNFATKTMLIDNVVENQVSFEPARYTYTLTLMSKTKELERIVLPNFSVTRPVNDDGTFGTALTLRQVIENLLNDYAPKYFIGTNWSSPYTLTGNVYLGDDCPDIQMSRPTLREAIDKVLSVKNCICKLRADNVIDIVDINQKNNAINMSKLNYVHENESSGDYGSTLDNIYNNVVPSTSLEDVQNTTELTEYLGFRDEPNGVVSEDNLYIQTKYPIYEIKKVVMKCLIGVAQNVDEYTSLDITDRVLEEKEFIKLDYGSATTPDRNATKTTAVYFTRGDNKIVNFSNNWKKFLRTHTVLDFLASSVRAKYWGLITGPFIVKQPRKTCSFEITYSPQVDSIRAKSGKVLPETHENNEIIDNPTEAFVDIYQQGKLFIQKVNRLGNRARIITGRFAKNDFNFMPKLGDYIDNFIVMNTEIEYYDNFAIYKAVLTENFININYFTGINARKRSWQIVGANEAFDKQLLDKYYCEFSFSQKFGLDNQEDWFKSDEIYLDYTEAGWDGNLAKHLADITFTNTDFNVDGCLFLNEYTKDVPLGMYFHELEVQRFISGNSIVFTCGMLDNFSSTVPSITPDQTEIASFKEEDGGIVEWYNRYTDNFGKCSRCSLIFFTKYTRRAMLASWGDRLNNVINMSDNDKFIEDNLAKTNTSNERIMYVYQGFKPRVSWSTFLNSLPYMTTNQQIFSTDFYNHKDSRETLNFNIQFEYCSDTPDIVFTQEFIKRKDIIASRGYSSSDYKIYACPEDYRYGDTELQSGSTLLSNAQLVVRSSTTQDHRNCCAEFEISTGESISHKSIAIVDATTNKLILAINDAEDNIVFYMNIIRNRDRKKYTSNSMKEWQ